MQNFPNPFNPGTRIKFHVPATSLVRLEVFNLMGQHIATLLEENRAAGEHELAWDGRSDLGQPVPSGVYLLSIRAGEFTQTRKMVLAR
jgi:flagellar hook assembly protein FlgD